MKKSSPLNAINWKQVVIYFIAFWLISHGALAFSYLFDLQLSEILRLSYNPKGEISANNYEAGRLADLNLFLALGRTIGLLFAFGIAFLLAKKIRGNWVNPVVAFVIALVLGIFNLLAWSILQSVFLTPGSRFSGSSYYVVNGLVLIILGLIILWVNHLSRKQRYAHRGV